MEYINNRYAQIATQVNDWWQDIKYVNKDPLQTSYLWLANNDARGYIIIGDPAVSLSLAAAGVSTADRLPLADVAPRPGSLPVVLSLAAVSEGELPAVETEIAAQADVVAFSVEGAGAAAGQPQPATTPAPGGTKTEAAAPPTPLTDEIPSADQAGASPISAASPYRTPFERLASTVQTYHSAEESFGVGEEAKNLVGPVVENLFKAVQGLAQRLQDAANAATLEVTTAVVDDLDAFNPRQPGAAQVIQRIKTTVSLTGDTQVYLPVQAQDVDDKLFAFHREMVHQAQANRLEMVKALAETIAALFY
jgi:hypothetical protein